MKRVRPMEPAQIGAQTGAQTGSWTVLPREPAVNRLPYRQELWPKMEKRIADPRESLDGIIDNAISAFQHNGAQLAAGREAKLMPALTPINIPKDMHGLHYVHTDPLARGPHCETPLLTTSYNTFEDFSTSAVSQQSSQQSPERDSFVKVGAEIDEILSPVSECGAKPIPNLHGIQSINSLLSIPPAEPEPPKPIISEQTIQAAILAQGKGKAMQEILRAMATPGVSGTGRRSMSSSSTQCHLCGKTYTESSNLSKHIRTVHLKLRPFQCNRCSSSFAEKNKLGKHIQSVHEHARPYKCELCSATFSQASDRKRHRLVLHEGRRPFSCEHCGKAFGRRSSLTQHCHRVHKRVKPQVVGQLHASKQVK